MSEFETDRRAILGDVASESDVCDVFVCVAPSPALSHLVPYGSGVNLCDRLIHRSAAVFGDD